MHPAKSVISFTTASGAGYGLLAWLILFRLLGLVPEDRGLALAGFGLAFVLVTGGLLASTFHLGHPERAWRALTQWRTSWLSREGVASLATYVPTGLFAIAWLAGVADHPLAVLLGILGIAGTIVTVYCTAMIYASLKPVAAWANGWVPAVYLVLAGATGALLLAFLLAASGADAWRPAGGIALALVAAGLALKLAYWRHVAADAPGSTAGSATGLGRLGRVRLLEAPHTGSNYLMREMGFQIARRHAGALRAVAVIAGFAVPAALLAVVLVLGAGTVGLLALAVASAAAGVYAERWLFFAEARHAVTLYYGASRA